MASEYLKQKYQDVKPNEPPPPLTGKKRLANWFHYNKLWIVVWAVILSIVGSIVWNMLGIGRIRPDYIFAYVGADPLPGDCVEALERELAALGEDVNGDGRVTAEVREYATNRGGDAETALSYNYAADVVLIADITEAESYFFIVEDPAGVQSAYQIFAQADGTPPEEDDLRVDDKVFQWSDCPVLAGLAVDQEPLESLYIGRRCFYDEKQAKNQDANDSLWNVITKGARR
ncbi:MAG: hypothetical protein K2M42_03125 [Oscillospiraceae bacterium]|nr:hypothetical protein [Oscillospiraceae bacterium]